MQSRYIAKLKKNFKLDSNYLDYIISSYLDKYKLSSLNSYLRLKKIIKKNIIKKIPIQYLIGHTYFYNDLFKVSNKVLIPRLDSEPMIEDILKLNLVNKSILEVGVGSGALIISVAKRKPSNSFEGVDISKKALKVAISNQFIHKTKINFYQSNLFENVNNKYDLIIANLPYLLNSEKNTELSYEPDIALYGGLDGLDIIYKFLDHLLNYLNIGGLCYLEHGITQQEKINIYLQKYTNYIEIENKNDLTSRPRYIIIRRLKWMIMKIK